MQLLSIHGNHDAGSWPIGDNSFLKINRGLWYDETTTKEVDTLDFVNKQGFSFQTPKVLHHFEHNETRYIFMTRVQGRTLKLAWFELEEKWQEHYLKMVVDATKEMAKLKGDKICGVDGKYLWNQQFSTIVYESINATSQDYSPETYSKRLQRMGIDCSSSVFHHTDLGPSNIIVEDKPEKGTIGIIDWYGGGFVPPGWILTSLLATPHIFEELWVEKLAPLLRAEGFKIHTKGFFKVHEEDMEVYRAWLTKRNEEWERKAKEAKEGTEAE